VLFLSGEQAVPTLRQDGWHPRCTVEYVEQVRVWCYALTDGLAIKVGKSTHDPAHRMNDLATGNPRPLTLIGKTGHLTEKQAHRRLGRWRIGNTEWFELMAVRMLGDWDYIDAHRLRTLLKGMRVQ
jgi:hypothetical protein